jgi:protein-disulfide isomerase
MSSPKQSSAAVKNRREFLELATAAGLTFAGAAGVFASSSLPLHAEGASVPVDQLMAPSSLPDIVEAKAGADAAPVTIVEYASMTCSHCAAFHATTYPVLMSKYVDTGKVRFVLREFPLDPLATAAFMLARCAGPERNAMVGLLFQQQRNWAFAQKPIEALASLVKQTGMSQASFEACLKDQDLHEKINEVRDRAAEKFGVEATPTFFFNGIKHNGAISPEELDKFLEPLLKG